MSQFDWGTLNPLTESGTQLMTDLNAFRSAIISSHIGSTRPTYLGAGGTWINNATSPWVVYWCTTGSSGGDVIMGYINPSTLVFTGSPDEGFLSKSVAGAANITLTTLESMNVLFEFTGAITANIAIIVPNNKKRYQVDNLTTGNFTLTVKTAVGTGVLIPQGDTLGLYCNGTNIEDANSMKVDTTGSTGSAVLPKGTTAQRDAIPLSGFLRYNTDTSDVEVYKGSAWEPMAGLGYGQTWQTVTRVSGTTYTNTTGKPIFLMYSVTSGVSTAGSITVTIGGIGVVYSYIPAITSVSNSAWVSGIVPPGSTYSTNYIGTPSPFTELR